MPPAHLRKSWSAGSAQLEAAPSAVLCRTHGLDHLHLHPYVCLTCFCSQSTPVAVSVM